MYIYVYMYIFMYIYIHICVCMYIGIGVCSEIKKKQIRGGARAAPRRIKGLKRRGHDTRVLDDVYKYM